MKKLLMGSIVLTILSFSIITFQLSCSKPANAQSGAALGLTQLNIILFERSTSTFPQVSELWIANIDGSNQKKIPITLPVGITLYPGSRLSPDGKFVIFQTRDSTITGSSLYSCDTNGSNLKLLFDGITKHDYYYDISGIY